MPAVDAGGALRWPRVEKPDMRLRGGASIGDIVIESLRAYDSVQLAAPDALEHLTPGAKTVVRLRLMHWTGMRHVWRARIRCQRPSRTRFGRQTRLAVLGGLP